KHKAFSIINIAGLAIGMTCSIFILLWVREEQSFDRFNSNADRLFRLTDNVGDFKAAVTPAGVAAGLKSQLPAIKNITRISKNHSAVFEVGTQKFQEKRLIYADSNFLEMFNYPLLKGNKNTALQNPGGILITENMAVKYFGQQDPLGRLIRINNADNYKVVGVLENIPSNSHLQFDFIIPMSAIEATDYDLKSKTWDSFNYYTYLELNDNTSPSALANLTNQILKIYKVHVSEFKVEFHLQPLLSIHLGQALQIDQPGHGNMQYVNIFFIVAIIVIAVACINFMNLATARSARRAKEVGLRKVVGAERYQIIGQFLGESVFISLLAFGIAMMLVWLLLPAFNNIADKSLSFRNIDLKLLLSLLGLSLVTGLISGIYPAIYLSGFKPVKVLKGKLKSMGGNLVFRNTLVVIQFIVSIVLLVGTAVVYQQLHFIKNMNLGFEKRNLVYVRMTGELWNKLGAIKTELKQRPLTSDYSIISDLPTELVTGTVDVQWQGKDPKSQIVIPSMDVDENFTKVFQMKVLNGRGFSSGFKGDSSNYVVNETAVRTMGMTVKNAVGKSLSFGQIKGTIIGVVKDFNFKPIQQSIEPLVLRLNKYGGYIFVRTKPGSTDQTIKSLEKICLQLNPAYPFEYSFLDEDLANLYKGEQRIGSLFNIFAILAIFISCLGLYGLSAFIAEQRTKEIGVRKTLGASVFNIVYLLSTNFTRVVFIAIIIAIPISWYAIHQWLQGFAYHIEIGWGVFAIGAFSALFIALCTVSFESIKSAVANPVKSLRSE
ncbi:MAG TPA: ABC transporter permease, partial [Puia sp.]|nr:ABC transporter permease [Puia sp.]